MKKTITFLLLIIAFNSFAQSEVDTIQIVPGGTNGYKVLYLAGMNSEEIYLQLKKWAEYNIRSAEVSNYSEIENEFLTYNIIFPKAVYEKAPFSQNYWDIVSDVEFRIKDNKLRIDFENLRVPTPDRVEISELEIEAGGITALFKSNGNAKRMYQKFIDQINSKLNSYVKELEDSILGNADYKKSDW